MIEARQGVAGYRETQDALENVSAMKSDMDNLKGRTLEDISHMVQQLTRKIADKVKENPLSRKVGVNNLFQV